MTGSMDTALFKAAFSANAIFLPASVTDTSACEASPAATAFTAALVKIGYTVDERLFHALCHLSNERIAEINIAVEDILGLHLNWMPMIRGWKTPTGTDYTDSLIAMFANILPSLRDLPGTTLPCGHFIPDGTFPLERYNGCPLCGRTFATSDAVYTGQGSRLKILTLWNENDLRQYERTLIESKIPLEGALTESLKILLTHFGLLPDVTIKIREISALAFITLTKAGNYGDAATLIKNPTDIMRALWYEKTGNTRIVRPKYIAARAAANAGYKWEPDFEERARTRYAEAKENLKLKYSRAMCRFVAGLLENLPMDSAAICEDMHPRREMWVRFIRALRLTSYARKSIYPKLREILDRFYRTDYEVWAGEVETAVLKKDTTRALRLLSQRPGAFARQLFATILHLGDRPVLDAFAESGKNAGLRLLLSIDMYADYCLDPTTERSVRLAGGTTRLIPANKYLALKTPEETSQMIAEVKATCAALIYNHFTEQGRLAGTVYIQRELFKIPVPVGERAVSNAAASYMPQGSRIAVIGDNIRLFLHWGEGLPAQHLDMDLSAIITYPDHSEDCAYYNLNPLGAIHSGDIQHIPDNVGAAEYIEIDIPALDAAGAVYVAFAASAYTAGGVSPTVRIGWMDAKYPMKVDNETGVAFDPSTVQFSTRMDTETLFDTIIFGVLDIKAREVILIEMLLKGQRAADISIKQILTHLKKLEKRMSIGSLLSIRAKARGQRITDDPTTADECFLADPAGFASVAAII